MSERATPTILAEIVAWNRGELARRRAQVPLAEMRRQAAQAAPPRDFAGALVSRVFKHSGTAQLPIPLPSGERERVRGDVGASRVNPRQGKAYPHPNPLPEREREQDAPPPSGRVLRPLLPLGEGGDEGPLHDHPSLIAEIKRASPSKGALFADLDPAALAAAYEAGGAAAISVLTEPRFFLGSLEDLAAAKVATHLPVLRKDFLFDPYQVFEARAGGADAVLLIVAILDDWQLAQLLALSRDLGLEALVECHDADEVRRALAAGAKIVGINNRDLSTFQVDLETTGRLRPLVPPGCLVVSESGVHAAADVARLREWQVDAMLVGEALVRSGDVAAKARELLT